MCPISERLAVPNCPECGSVSSKVIRDAPTVHGDLNDFHTENGGKGRYNKQLQTYVTSVDDAIKKAEKRGWSVLDKA